MDADLTPIHPQHVKSLSHVQRERLAYVDPSLLYG
jgi:hypothetical protein